MVAVAFACGAAAWIGIRAYLRRGVDASLESVAAKYNIDPREYTRLSNDADGKRANRDEVSFLKDEVLSKNPEVRQMAYQGLSNVPVAYREEVYPILERMDNDPDKTVRYHTAFCLMRAQDPKWMEVATAYRASEDPDLRNGAEMAFEGEELRKERLQAKEKLH